MKRKFSKKDILKYLEQVNIKLEERGKFGEIMICGGAALTLIYQARDSTRDIDAVFSPKEDLKEIISEISRENKLDSQWLNDDVGMFAEEFKNLTSSEYLKFSSLKVSVLDTESLLAMKLVAARPDTYDLSDAVALMKYLEIKKVEELYAIIEKYDFPLQSTALYQSRKFAEQAFGEYMRGGSSKLPPKKNLQEKLNAAKEKVKAHPKNHKRNGSKSKDEESL